MASNETTTFNIKVTMQNRWIPHFLGMLKRMQYLGGIGSSRTVSIMSDGDGDFRPEFEWDIDVELAEPRRESDGGSAHYDAG